MLRIVLNEVCDCTVQLYVLLIKTLNNYCVIVSYFRFKIKILTEPSIMFAICDQCRQVFRGGRTAPNIVSISFANKLDLPHF